VVSAGTNVWIGRNYRYYEEDDLEVWICQRIKAGSLYVKEAFDRLTTD
jgi:hypothetical protein